MRQRQYLAHQAVRRFLQLAKDNVDLSNHDPNDTTTPLERNRQAWAALSRQERRLIQGLGYSWHDDQGLVRNIRP